jgi:cation diffusion facilitator CzcD-associated flavoprotein CzcO
VIGAGFGGIATGVKLKKAGLNDFTIFEKSDGPGGVWHDNRYPGAEVDTPTHTYSFSFMRYDWTRSHAGQKELLQYMNDTIDAFKIRDKFRFSEQALEIVWDEGASFYRLTTPLGTYEFEYVISAVGLLNVAKFPDWPGLDDFAGPKFHTSQWEGHHNLSGKRVTVVGTGSSAAQVVPKVATVADHVYVFQREPGWVGPKPIVEYDNQRRAELKNPLRYKIERLKGYRRAAESRKGGKIHIVGSAANIAASDAHRAYIGKVFADRPDLQKLVTPDHPFYGKRPIKDSNYYEALKRDNVELIPSAVVSVTSDAVVDANGVKHPTDVLVMSTGFQPSRFLSQLSVRGRDDIDIQDYWHGDASAFAGITVPNFPNFFMLYGPNTNSPVVLFFLERQAEYAIRAIKAARRRRAKKVAVRKTAYDRYNAWLAKQLEGSVWETSNNYYKSESGRVVTQWPVSPTVYWAITRIPIRLTAKFSR